ncbi:MULTISPECIES: hypothetical protein [unclassified Streptomyces]|uniref:hypothetical protein n=1 Tax=unclassified Streptomyces TaxID=2593676 RepID=UPI000DC4E5DB|nr:MULTISPECIES: hypothetical protein [unclassified Streptomyces]MYT70371.1 hypothetical protein [Streptomyces sp. SID8367]RAJ70559.1 hypothetical protein K377_07969 [Streptomyces sp. PsTaAH-137]
MSGSNSETDPLAAKVLAWLSTQGYPLEMRVAQKLRDNAIRFIQSEFYRDSESGDLREIDLSIRIQLRDHEEEVVTPYLCPVIECKSSPGKPWILFSGGVELHDSVKIAQRYVLDRAWKHWSNFASQATKGRVTSGPWAHHFPLFSYSDPPAYSAVRTSLGKNREDAAYAAMTSVTKAAHSIANQYTIRGNTAYQIAVPIIVVDSPIYSCRLGIDGDLEIERVTKGTVVWRNKVPGNSMPHAIITIISEEAVPDFCADLKGTAESLRGYFKRFPWHDRPT